MKKLVCVLLFILYPFIVFSNTTENIVITGTVNQYLNLTPQSNTIQLTITGDGSEAVELIQLLLYQISNHGKW